MNINGWFTPSTVKVVVAGLFMMGFLFATLKADIAALDISKAEKIDVATQVATQTEVLKSINRSLTKMAASYENLDKRQRDTEIQQARQEAEIAALKAK